MKTAHVCVRLALLDARMKAKNKYDRNRSTPDFAEGDIVGLRAPPRQSKLSLKWRGPFIVSDPCNNTVVLKSVPHGPPSTSTRVNVDRLIHLNLSGDLGTTTTADRLGERDQQNLADVPVIPVPRQTTGDPRVSAPSVVTTPPERLPKQSITEADTRQVCPDKLSRVGDTHQRGAAEGSDELTDHGRDFALVDRSSRDDFVAIGTTQDDRTMITALFNACPEQGGLSPRRAVELIMGYPGYRRGYLKNVIRHTISLTIDRYGWLQRLHDRLYFIEDTLGVGYVIGELLRSSITGEEKQHLVRFYQTVRPGSDVIREERTPSEWIQDRDVIFPLAVTTERLPNGHLRLTKESFARLEPYNFSLEDYDPPSVGLYDSGF
ncbi:hypothetical protein FOZ60_001315 [Perkinsus olseni]|nr:hypothetical protein FOZ60_001315 [Perkinsus olseni]